MLLTTLNKSCYYVFIWIYFEAEGWL